MAINKNKVNDNALKYIQKGQIKKAIREYDKILIEDPKDVRTLLKKGDLLVRIGDKEQALNTYFSVAKTYSQQGFHLKAVAVYKQILKIDETRVDVNLHLAGEYQNLGIVGDAMGHMQKVAAHYEQRGMKKQLMEILRRLVDLDPDSVASRIKLAELYSQEAMTQEAVEEFRQAAQYLKVTNRIEDYIKVVERLLFHDSSDLSMVRELANIYLQKGDAKRALSKLQACFKADPTDIDTLSMLALAFKELHQPVKTISVYKEMIKIYQERGQQKEIGSTYQRILALSPDDPEALQALNMQAPGESVGPRIEEPELPSPSVDEEPESEDPPSHISSLRPPQPVVEPDDELRPRSTRLQDVQEIVSSKDRSGKDSVQGDIGKMLNETSVYIKYGLQNKAIEHLKRIVDLDYENIEAHQKLKDIYAFNRQSDETASELITLIRLQKARDQIDEARENLRSLLLLNPDHPQAEQLMRELNGTSNELEVEVLDDDLPELLDASGVEVVVDDPENIEVSMDAGLDGLENAAYENSADNEDADSLDLEQEVYIGIGPETDDVIIGDESDQESFDEREVPAKLEPIESEMEDSESSPNEQLPFEMIDDADLILGAEESEEYDENSAGVDYLDLLDSDSGLDHDAEAVADSMDESGLIDIEEIDASFDQIDANMHEDLMQVPDDPTQMIENPIWPTEQPEDEQAEAVEPAHVQDLEDWEEEEIGTDDPLAESSGDDLELESVEEPLPEDDDSDLADALEEVDFFIQQNLFEEAFDELSRLKQAYSENEEVLMRLEQVSRMQQGESQVMAAQLEDSDLTMDLAEQIAGEIDDELEPVALDEDFQYSVNDVFNEFKKGVAKIVAKDDSSTHYDLGIAYKEMGLLDEAINEFSIASSSEEKRVVAMTMIGLCYTEMGQTVKAVESFTNALKFPAISEQEKTSLYYELGRALELGERPQDALTQYKQVYKRDAAFRDVAEKIQRLSQSRSHDNPSDNQTPGHSTNGKNKISYM